MANVGVPLIESITRELVMRWNHGIAGLGWAAVAVSVMSCSSDSGSGPAQPATAIAVNSGFVQTAPVGTTLPTPIGVKVTDAGGDGVAGVAVTFTVTANGGTVAAAGPVTTNAQGIASTTWTIGTLAGVGRNTATASAAGLTGSPVTFTATGTPGAPAAVTIVSGNNQNAVFFTQPTAPLVVRVSDAYNNAIVGTTVNWSISGGGSVSVGTGPTDALGMTSVTRTVGGTMTGNLTTASIAGGVVPPAQFVTLATAVPSSYNVEVVFLTPVTDNQRTAFLDAAARWSSIIVSGFAPDTVVAAPASCSDNTPAIDQAITSVLIYATIAPIDGPGQILGGASPCWVRLPGFTSLVGDMTFDVADMPQLEAMNLLKPVILHEMGHVLGFGTLWNCPNPPIVGFNCPNPPLLIYGGTDSTHFVGTAANNYYTAAGGVAMFPSLLPVPVENTGGPGTQDGHWRETVMKAELMTGYVAAGASPLSSITIGSLFDKGYTVSYATADAYAVTAPPFGVPAIGAAVHLKEQVRTGPIRGVDRQGRITRVR
jgi:hypothetical protein